jgi:peptidoglycan/xylan/chitin deacetylase (PgdA/CDA1 family)
VLFAVEVLGVAGVLFVAGVAFVVGVTFAAEVRLVVEVLFAVGVAFDAGLPAFEAGVAVAAEVRRVVVRDPVERDAADRDEADRDVVLADDAADRFARAVAVTVRPPVAPAEPAPAPDLVPPAPADVPVVAPYATVIGWHGDAKVVYLTFDDGPGPATGRVLDILAASGVKATFCQLGLRVADAPDVTRRVVAEGHTLCNHSWDHHSPFDALAPADLDSEIGRTQDAFSQAAGVAARYFRAPEGAFGPTGGAVLQAAQRARTIPLGWGVDSLDWRKPGVDAIVANVMTAVSPGAVILLHDGGGTDREQTLAALPGIIAGLQAAGYTLAAMPADPAG